MSRNVFTRHPAQSGETYAQHFAFAAWVGIRLTAAGLAALAHAVFPFVLKTTASRMLTEVHDAIERRRAAAISAAQCDDA